ncbi:MAG: lipopolysaccharide biosynthesis protein [Bacteroidales bacterium]|nr:lipopolysaccharide biosynthesis protein [Bacteroidales bacterium]
MGNDVKSQTINGVKWSGIESISTQLITFVIGVILARLLAPSDYGVIGLLTVFMVFSNTFINAGFTTALIRKADMTDVDCSTVFYCNILISIACYIILFICSPLIADFFDAPILSEVVKVYCLTLIIGAFESVQISRLTKKLQFKSLAIVNVFTSVTSGIIGISLAYMGWGVWALVWQSVLNGILHAVLIWIVSRWKPGFIFSKESFHEIFAFGKNLLFSGLLFNIYSQLSPLIISKFFSLADLGQYNRGVSYASLPSNTINGILEKVTFPIFANYQNDKDRLLYLYRRYIKSSSMIIMFSLILLAALAKPLVLFTITDIWADCIIYLQIYIFGACFRHLSHINLNLIKVIGRSDLILNLELWKRGISIAMIFAAIPFGVIGICISMVIFVHIDLAFNTYYTGKLFGFGYFKQMKDYMPYFLISLMCCTPAFLMTYLNLPYTVSILLGCIVSLTLYCSCLYMKKDNEFLELANPYINRIKRIF